MRFLLLVCALSTTAAFGADKNTESILKQQTQALMNAITSGSADVWDHYLDDKARITDENGKVLTKSDLVKQTKPLAVGVSGIIDVIDFSAVIKGNVAITNYVCDEHENYHGQQLHCQYRSTDTWVKTANTWRLLGSQVLALHTDPPAAQLKDEDANAYIGRFQLAPGFVYEIRKKGNALERQRTGRKPEPLIAEAPDVFFVPGSPRYRTIFRRDAAGHVVDFVERREAWDLVWTRLAD